MEPAKRHISVITEIEYWVCLDEGHRHRAKATAERCIASHKFRDEAVKTDENVNDAARYYAAGAHLSAIGKDYGRSGMAIKKWIFGWLRKKLIRSIGSIEAWEVTQSLKSSGDLRDAVRREILREDVNRGLMDEIADCNDYTSRDARKKQVA